MATPENKLAFDGGWQYSPAPESTDHINVKTKYDLFIGGEFVAPESGRYFDTVNPATEERLAKVADADDAVATDAILMSWPSSACRAIPTIVGYTQTAATCGKPGIASCKWIAF